MNSQADTNRNSPSLSLSLPKLLHKVSKPQPEPEQLRFAVSVSEYESKSEFAAVCVCVCLWFFVLRENFYVLPGKCAVSNRSGYGQRGGKGTGGCVGISFVGTRRKCFINAEHKTRIAKMCAAYQFVCFCKREKYAKYFKNICSRLTSSYPVAPSSNWIVFNCWHCDNVVHIKCEGYTASTTFVHNYRVFTACLYIRVFHLRSLQLQFMHINQQQRLECSFS